MAETSGKFARWLSLIGSVDFGVYHRPGSEIGQADALSRMWQVEMKKGVISNAADAEIVEYLSGVDNGVF